MLIALDYDGTYTADPDLWDRFSADATQRGHEVLIVTMRYEHEPIGRGLWIGVIYTGRRAKKPFLATKGIAPDIWIDDHPEWLLIDTE